jgi:hypothetical protein
MGRQEVNLHEHRLVGNVGWTQQARSFDGAKTSFSKNGWSGDLAVFQLIEKDIQLTTNDAAMVLFRAGRSTDSITADLVYLVLADGNLDRLSYTPGVYLKGNGGILSGRAEAYVQVGKRGGLSEFAYMFGLQGTLAPEVSGKPKFTLWYDHLSGDTDPLDNTVGSFDTMFATNHKFYGLMDVMAFGVGGNADGRGLQDAALKLGASPVEKLSVNLDAHVFMAPAPQGGDAMLGQEVDAWLKVKITQGFASSVGMAALMRPNVDQPDMWSFVQFGAKL